MSAEHPDSEFRVLAIDGGGVRGIIPAMVLAELEQRAGRPVAELFDLIAGTSTGGILAYGLTVRGQGAGPRYTAQDIAELYEREASTIFARGRRHAIRSAGGLLAQRYRADGIESVLERYFGEETLSGTMVDVMVPAYDIEQRARYWLKSRKARVDPSDDALVREAARATAAAPTYFPPAELARKHRSRALIDGGVFANNPALAAYAEARDNYNAQDVVVLSLGTGNDRRPLDARKAATWGAARWARPLLDIVFDGVSKEAHYSLRKLLGDGNYFRMQPRLDGIQAALDASSPKAIHMLKVDANQLIFEQREMLNGLARRLQR